MSFTKTSKTETVASTRCQECTSLIQSILEKRSEKLAKVYADEKGKYTYLPGEKKAKVSEVYQKYGSKMKKAMEKKEEEGHVCHEEDKEEEEEEEDEDDYDSEDDEDYVPSEDEDEDEDDYEYDSEYDEDDEFCDDPHCEENGEEDEEDEEDEKYFGCEGCNYEWRDGFKAGWVKAMNYIYKKTNKAIPKTYVCSNCNIMSDMTKKCGGTCGGCAVLF